MFKTATAIGCFCFEYSIQWQKFIRIEELWFFYFRKHLVSASGKYHWKHEQVTQK
jgi:hypothetical protein